MPEVLEVEIYRLAASRTIGRTIARVDAPDPWFLKGGIDARDLDEAIAGRSFAAARRIGKLLLLDVDSGPTIGLRFGMTGVLDLDGTDAVDDLVYGSSKRNPAWERFAVHFVEGGALRLRDPRRLGGVELDPDETRLGPDAAEIDRDALAAALAGSTAPLKARVMDQSRLAGLGNLLADDALWRARLDPARAAGSLDSEEISRLHRSIRATLRVLGRRGGSHTGDLQAERHRGGRCPRCGAELLRRTIGGRTTFSCPTEQL